MSKIWDRLTKQEQEWILGEKCTPEDANESESDTAQFLTERYAENGYQLADVSSMRKRIFEGV